MKAKYEPRIDLVNRTKLEEVIPLDTPFVVFVDPSDACNFKCRFCPTSDRDLMKSVGRPWKQLSFELFKKIADDMTQFSNKVEVLRLYKDGEPLLNKRLADMIKYAKDVGASKRIDTTTNAALLTKERGKAIAEAGLDRINISIYGVSNEHYINFSGVKLEFERVLANVRDFYEIRGQCEMLVKVNGDSLNEVEKQIFLDQFGDYSDKIYIEHTMSCWPEFELNGVEVNKNAGIYGQEIKEVNACPYPFYAMAVNSDGLVSICFLDWGRKLNIGDANDTPLLKVWTGEKMRAYQKMFLEGRRKEHPVCGNCGQMTHGSPDNIDQYRQDLLDKLNKVGYFAGIEELIPANTHKSHLINCVEKV
jgi:MoaA/NifB/PqqE/SkfB family radical SAM enzyme